MHVIAELEIRVLSALRGLFINARWTFSFASSATMTTYFDGTREGLHGGLIEGSHGQGDGTRLRLASRRRLRDYHELPAAQGACVRALRPPGVVL